VHAKRIAGIGCDTGRILTAMLQQQQCIVDQLIDGAMGNDANYATHGGLLNKTQNRLKPASAVRDAT
jgi:hypothetical protein